MSTTKKLEMSEEEYAAGSEDGGGICLKCGEHCSGVEPDARGYPCEACGERAVHGLEEALLMGAIVFTEDLNSDGVTP